jgi:hypothetical protein
MIDDRRNQPSPKNVDAAPSHGIALGVEPRDGRSNQDGEDIPGELLGARRAEFGSHLGDHATEDSFSFAEHPSGRSLINDENGDRCCRVGREAIDSTHTASEEFGDPRLDSDQIGSEDQNAGRGDAEVKHGKYQQRHGGRANQIARRVNSAAR